MRRTTRHLDFFFVFAAGPLSGGSGGSLPEERTDGSFGSWGGGTEPDRVTPVGAADRTGGAMGGSPYRRSP
ncbi:hypothetical protein CH272_16930 [Rhodococcus sp. 05-340-1]|nr:hypothetical protein CH271_01400 [Rhodococcus sp. 05-340-2]OZD75462.1 hypothetical protein CH272_16930 [Rhodococcus sp. 05-340-1]OZE98467.1 hypothetical protein CH302_12810 [Rhodococcus sp. 15-2388-1-1a]OZF34986.1 hypothetical protein CH295_09065 [Rhodococcus sp. 14-2483-1-2]